MGTYSTIRTNNELIGPHLVDNGHEWILASVIQHYSAHKKFKTCLENQQVRKANSIRP